MEPLQSLETLKRHKQTHNDIKPQNFLVKFSMGYDTNDLTKNDLTHIEIALTDFGMADAKGGTPVYASPECVEKTNTKSDIFSFGRLILFLLLKKVQFMKWLYIPIKNKARIYIRNKKFFFELFLECFNSRSSNKADFTNLSNMISKNFGTTLQLVSKMTLVRNRIDLKSARIIFNSLRTSKKIKLPVDLINSIDGTIINNMTSTANDYAYDLSAIR